MSTPSLCTALGLNSLILQRRIDEQGSARTHFSRRNYLNLPEIAISFTEIVMVLVQRYSNKIIISWVTIKLPLIDGHQF